jgi:hypothetical protein
MSCFASLRFAVLAAVLTCPCNVAPAAAQEPRLRPIVAIDLEAAPLLPVPAVPPVDDANPQGARVAAHRPPALIPMYVTFASLQVLDAHSTSRALDRGAVEANPVMRGLAGNTAALLALKAAGTTGIVYSAERMWRRNRTAAVLFMVAANSGMAWVVNHNYQSVR